MWDVVVVGSANTDFIEGAGELLVPGKPEHDVVHRPAPGGRGANQAIAAARLGARVSLVARVGDDTRGAAVLGFRTLAS